MALSVSVLNWLMHLPRKSSPSLRIVSGWICSVSHHFPRFHESIPWFYVTTIHCLLYLCLFLFIADAPKPVLSDPKSATQDRPYSLTCSVTHTCPSHAPKLKWSRGTADDDVTEVHRQLPIGFWEVHSTLTFIPGEKDDHSEITCTAEFHGKERRTSSSTMTLYIKREIFSLCCRILRIFFILK